MCQLSPEQLAVPFDHFEKEAVPYLLLTDAQFEVRALDDGISQRYEVGRGSDSPAAIDAVVKHISTKMDQPFNTIILNARPRGNETTVFSYNPVSIIATGPRYIGKVVELALLGHPKIVTWTADNILNDPYVMNTGLAIGLSADARHRIFYTGNSKYLRTMFLGYDVTKSAS